MDPIARTVQIFGVEKVIKTPFEINFRDTFFPEQDTEREPMYATAQTAGRWSLPNIQHSDYYDCYKHIERRFLFVKHSIHFAPFM